MDEDYYRILGVSEDAEPEVIEAAFKAMAKKYHPDIWKGDKSFATEKLKKLNEARDILRNSEKRAAYDQEKNKDAKTSSTNNENQTLITKELGTTLEQRIPIKQQVRGNKQVIQKQLISDAG